MPHQMHIRPGSSFIAINTFRNDLFHFPKLPFGYLVQHDQAGCLRCRHLQCGVKKYEVIIDLPISLKTYFLIFQNKQELSLKLP